MRPPILSGGAPSDAADASQPATRLLRRVARAALVWAAADGTLRFPLDGVSAPDRVQLAGVLGRGEVSGRIDGPQPVGFTESVCPGVWMVAGPGSDSIEVGGLPACVALCSAGLPLPVLPDPAALPTGHMNALPLIAELHAAATEARPGPTRVNLSLLPLSPADHAILDAWLGVGPMAMESCGYGRVRVTSAAVARVWRVRYYNASGTLVHDAIEVGDVPADTVATEEDVHDGGHHLLSILDVI